VCRRGGAVELGYVWLEGRRVRASVCNVMGMSCGGMEGNERERAGEVEGLLWEGEGVDAGEDVR
jgi:hypothetical protein